MAKQLYVIYDKNLDCDIEMFVANSEYEAKRSFIQRATRGLRLDLWIDFEYVEGHLFIRKPHELDVRHHLLDFDEFLDRVQRNEQIEVNDE